MIELFNTILVNPIFQALSFFYSVSGNYGIAILLLTLGIRTLLVPFTLPTIKSQKKMRDIKPELDKIKLEHKNEPQKLQQAQMELYKKHNINVFAGCLPNIVQIIVLLALFSVFRTFVEKNISQGIALNTQFIFWDLASKDTTYIIPILCGLTQLIFSLMLLTGLEKHDVISDTAKSKKLKVANKEETQNQDMADMMQKQSLFIFPLMTVWFAVSNPSALGFYWIITTVFSIVQQWIIAGPGGLVDAYAWIQKRLNRA